MVLSLLISFGTVVGAHEGIKASQAKARKEEHRSRKNNLMVQCAKSSQYSPYLEGRRVVLSGDRLFIDTGTAHDVPFGHPFEGYYLPYPDSPFPGLVTTITHEAPIMNWVFIDPVTYQLRFGVRAVADHNLTGPWDCTRQDRRLTFAGWEGFCAVLEETGVWGLYFDIDGDGMRQRFGQHGAVVIEIELMRRELRTPKPEIVLPDPEPTPESQPEEKAHQTAADGATNPAEENTPVATSEEQTNGTSLQTNGGATEAGVSTDKSSAPDPQVSDAPQEEVKKEIPKANGTIRAQDRDLEETMSELSVESAVSAGGTTKRVRKRNRNRGAKKYQRPSVENSEDSG